jgi:hypothetical protein
VEIFSVNRPETIYVPKVLSVGNPADRIGRNIEPRQESRGFFASRSRAAGAPCQFEFGKKAARVGGGRLSDAGLTLAEGATDSQG